MLESPTPLNKGGWICGSKKAGRDECAIWHHNLDTQINGVQETGHRDSFLHHVHSSEVSPAVSTCIKECTTKPLIKLEKGSSGNNNHFCNKDMLGILGIAHGDLKQAVWVIV